MRRSEMCCRLDHVLHLGAKHRNVARGMSAEAAGRRNHPDFRQDSAQLDNAFRDLHFKSVRPLFEKVTFSKWLNLAVRAYVSSDKTDERASRGRILAGWRLGGRRDARCAHAIPHHPTRFWRIREISRLFPPDPLSRI